PGPRGCGGAAGPGRPGAGGDLGGGRSSPPPGAVRRGHPLKEPEVEGYVEAIESHLRARRGGEHILSPRDFALARAWHESGVPLATVLVGIDRAFDEGGRVSSLGYCRRRVEELVLAGARPQLRPIPTPESLPL